MELTTALVALRRAGRRAGVVPCGFAASVETRVQGGTDTMSVRGWAIKPGELKPLDRRGRLLFAARCAVRVEPWVPESALRSWQAGLASLVNHASSEPRAAADVKREARALGDQGARAQNAHEAIDGPSASAFGYAVATLTEAIAATALPAGTELTKQVILSAKMAASIAALMAHAGRAGAPVGSAGADIVEAAAVTTWGAMRADIPLLAALVQAAPEALDVATLRELGPLWPGLREAPPWSCPTPSR